jgi:hypothetical protein
MANRYSDPVPQYFDSSGNARVGGFLYFYVTLTSTPADTYSDATLVTPNANPITLDASGAVPDDIFLDPTITYKVVLTDSAGATIWTRDPVSDPAANVTAAFRVYPGDPNSNVAGSAGSVGGSSASVIFDIANNILWVCTTSGTASTAVWTQIGATLSGAVTFSSVVSPASLAADQNDYTPASFSIASHLRQDCSADVNITGLAAGVTGRVLVWTNVSTLYTQTFKAQSASSAAANRFIMQGDTIVEPGQSVWLWYDATSARWRVIGGAASAMLGEPVITSDVTGASTVYYTPYKHNYAKLYNGGSWYPVQFSELSQTLADTTKSPAAGAADQCYDMFLWLDSGTLRCTRGPAWARAGASVDDYVFSRSTGAGTTELERVDGVYVNKVDIVNGPTAQRGLYVGTIAVATAGTMNVMLFPAAAAGGAAAKVDIWNNYNRVPVCSTSRDSTNSWTYTTATFRKMNNNANNRISFVAGLNEGRIAATVHLAAYNGGAATWISAGIGVDSITAASGLIGTTPSTSTVATRPTQVISHYTGLTGIGRKYLQALEAAEASGTTTWVGDNNTPLFVQAGIQAQWDY